MSAEPVDYSLGPAGAAPTPFFNVAPQARTGGYAVYRDPEATVVLAGAANIAYLHWIEGTLSDQPQMSWDMTSFTVAGSYIAYLQFQVDPGTDVTGADIVIRVGRGATETGGLTVQEMIYLDPTDTTTVHTVRIPLASGVGNWLQIKMLDGASDFVSGADRRIRVLPTMALIAA